jgi:hypothetical protein
MIRSLVRFGLTASTAIAMTAAVAMFDTASADPYRWCAHYSGGMAGGASNCWFMTLQQCRATISGVGGYCAPNPFYDGLPIGSTQAPRSRSRYY